MALEDRTDIVLILRHIISAFDDLKLFLNRLKWFFQCVCSRSWYIPSHTPWENAWFAEIAERVFVWVRADPSASLGISVLIWIAKCCVRLKARFRLMNGRLTVGCDYSKPLAPLLLVSEPTRRLGFRCSVSLMVSLDLDIWFHRLQWCRLHFHDLVILKMRKSFNLWVD